MEATIVELTSNHCWINVEDIDGNKLTLRVDAKSLRRGDHFSVYLSANDEVGEDVDIHKGFALIAKIRDTFDVTTRRNPIMPGMRPHEWNYHFDLEGFTFSVIPGMGQVWAWPTDREYDTLTKAPLTKTSDDDIIAYIKAVTS